MTAKFPSNALVTVQPVFTESERLAAWCRARSPSLFSVLRADIETFARDLEANGRARATVTRRLCTIAGLYIL